MLRAIWRDFCAALSRAFPEVGTHTQAVAFNSFLAFLPVLLGVLAVLSWLPRQSAGAQEIVLRLRTILPAGSRQVITDYVLSDRGDPAAWLLLGVAGALLAGSQVMSSLIAGFRAMHGDPPGPGFWRDQGRGLLMLCLSIVPWMTSVILTVFGRQLRNWMIARFGLAGLINAVWSVIYTALALVLAMVSLAVVYRFGRRASRGWNEVWPGTLLATLLWWAVNSSFGWYVRVVPYSQVYGGLAAAIGLLVWLYLSALVVFIGAAYNAEVLARLVREPTVLPRFLRFLYAPESGRAHTEKKPNSST
jgi:membrane protein